MRIKIISDLMKQLRHTDMACKAPSRMTYSTIPWTTDQMIGDTPIQVLMSPPVSGSPVEVENIFDAWCYPLVEGGSKGVTELINLGYGDIAVFLKVNAKDLPTQAVLLLYALGKAEGAALAYSENDIWVKHGDLRYGVDARGVVHSRFCTGVKLEVRPKAVLDSVRQVRTGDVLFPRLYREAYKQGGEALNTLIALRMGQPRLSFGPYLDEATKPPLPTKKQLTELENILYLPKDPIGKLYRLMVPTWMTPTEFRKTFCLLSTRPLKPSILIRQNHVGKLHMFFHNKNKKKEIK